MLFFLTGAGFSAESGLCTFRGNVGLWNGYRVENIASKEAFTKCPICGKKGFIRPNIVLFNEPIFYVRQIEQLIKQADLFVAAGTSDEIPPASIFAKETKSGGAKTVALNLTLPLNYRYFDTVILGKVSKTLPKFIMEHWARFSGKC